MIAKQVSNNPICVNIIAADKEAWSKLFYLIETPEDACATMELMLSDAAVRDSNDWDWNTQGYGQTVFQLIQVCVDPNTIHIPAL